VDAFLFQRAIDPRSIPATEEAVIEMLRAHPHYGKLF